MGSQYLSANLKQGVVTFSISQLIFLLLFFKGFVFNSLILSLEEAKAFLKISGGGGELGPIEGLSQRSLSEVS